MGLASVGIWSVAKRRAKRKSTCSSLNKRRDWFVVLLVLSILPCHCRNTLEETYLFEHVSVVVSRQKAEQACETARIRKEILGPGTNMMKNRSINGTTRLV